MTLLELEALLTLDTKDFQSKAKSAETTAKNLKKNLDDAEESSSAWATAIGTSVGKAIYDIFSGTIKILSEFAVDSIKEAKELETIDKLVDSTFGSSAQKIDRWAQTAVQSIGMSEKAAKHYANVFGAAFRQTGQDEIEVYKKSVELTERVADIAAHFGASQEDVADAIDAAFRGEYDPIQKWIKGASAGEVASYALEKGIISSTSAFSKLSGAEQTLIRFDYIMSQTDYTQGSYAKNSGTLAGQINELKANIDNLQTTLGSSFLPLLTSLTQIMNDLFTGEENVSDGVNAVKDAFAGELATAESTATKALALVKALEELEKTSEDAASTETWSAILNELGQTIPGIGNLINEQTGKIEGGAAALREYIDNWKELSIEASKQKAMQGLMDEYSAKAEQLASLKYEQMIADKLKKEYAGMLPGYEQEFAQTIEAGMRALGYSEDDIAVYKAGSETLGAAQIFTKLLNGRSIEEVLYSSDLGFGQSALDSLLSLWEAGGGTKDTFAALAAAWGSATSERQKYEGVDNAARIAELEEFLTSKETELEALASILDVLYGDLCDTPSEPTDGSETTENPPVEETTTEAETSAQAAATVAQETATAAQETAAEVAAAAEEAATAAQQVTETAAQMTADANSTDAMLITVLQGLPGNIATAVGGMSVTLDGDTIVGYVSAAMAREARGSQNTGG